jgi:uncharacterized protein
MVPILIEEKLSLLYEFPICNNSQYQELDITLNKKFGGGRKYGRKFINGLGKNKSKDWKNNRKSFDSSRIIRKGIPISNNG